jgi:hypothetical protein
MEFFDFISEDELASLPSDDPERGFVQFVRLADTKLQAKIDQISQEDNSSQSIEEAQYGFQNVVFGAARHFKIEPFAQAQLPPIEQYRWEQYRQFRADLTHYITQIMFRTTAAERNDSAALTDAIRMNLREHIAKLRIAVDESDLSDPRKAALHKKLSAFEEEIGKSRVKFVVVASVVFTILSVPGNLWASYEAVTKLSAMVMRDVGEAKTIENDNRHPIAQEPLAPLQPPRPPQLRSLFQRDEMDDEIPF